MSYWTRLGTTVLMILGMVAPVAAQESEASGPHLPADSMEIGASYMEMILHHGSNDGPV